MAGLISQAQQQPPQGGTQQPQQQPAPPQPQPPQGQPGPQGKKPPQEQKEVASQEAYDVATGQMLTFVYDKDGIETLKSSVEATGDPQQAMARLLGRLLTMTVQSAMMSGKRIAPDLIFQGGIEVIRAISEVAQAQGLIDPAQEKQLAEAAFFDGLALFANEAQEDALTEGERQRYVELLDMIEEMEAQGVGAPKGQSPGPQSAPQGRPQQGSPQRGAPQERRT